MKNIVKILICLFFALSFAGCLSSLSARQIHISVDGAFFRYDDAKVVWEMYYTFPDTSLNYVIKDNKYNGELYVSVTINNSTGQVDQKEWIVTYQKDSVHQIGKMDLLGLKTFILDPGQYQAEMFVQDLNDTTTQASTKFDLIARKISINNIDISDIQLAQNIEKENWSAQLNPIFKKNGLFVIPNPSLMYIGKNPSVYVYTELYNTKKIALDSFAINYRIYDAVKREVINFHKENKALADAVVETNTIPVNVLPTGIYFLQVILSYPLREPKDSVCVSKKFYINNPEIPPCIDLSFMENASYEKSEFAILNPDQIEIEFDKVKCIAKATELDLWDGLGTPDAKRKFLYRFWLSRDPDSTSTYNEALEKYRELIAYANTYFSVGNKKDGWKTDRGRVLLRYGKPTQRDQYPAKSDYRPYETWFYSDIQGGISFNFVDMGGFGNFTLVNSSAIGESRNDNWYNQYVPAHNSDGYKELLNNQRR